MCLMTNPIAGHHRGLYDLDELRPLLNGEIAEDINCEVSNKVVPVLRLKLRSTEIHHLSRMLFSCLVDADFLDTEKFMDNKSYLLRGNYNSISELRTKLETYLHSFITVQSSEINKLRSIVQLKCKNNSDLPSGIFELTVPTGGGKTIASIIWAINHALYRGKQRIIIVIPYTSIIVQTAHILRNIFGPENVLEHHSVASEDKMNDRTRLAIENWDAPIVVTTNVQFFESIFSNKPSKCRKLHSIVNSVVILDEAQSLPKSFMQPISDAIQTYVKIFGTSFLLCTATQPVLAGKQKGCGIAEYNGFASDSVKRIIGEDMKLHDKLRRVNLQFDDSPLTAEEIVERLSLDHQVLCIVNTRAIAAEIFGHLKKGSDNFHLSRMMCPIHLRHILDKIKSRLDSGSSIRVIATQLIEAGVDIDFPVVYRQLAGLDSLLQAAGRCNREGRKPKAVTYVFQKKGYTPHGSLKDSVYAMEELLRLHPQADWFDPETIREYYKVLYMRTPSFDSKNISQMYSVPWEVRYEEIARCFKLIDDDGMPLIVNYADAAEKITRLKNDGPSRLLMRELGQYTVSVNRKQFAEMFNAGMIEEPFKGVYYVADAMLYDPDIGLKTNNEYLEQTFVI